MIGTVTEPYIDHRSTRRSPPWIVTVKVGTKIENLKSNTKEDATALRQKLINQGYEPVGRR